MAQYIDKSALVAEIEKRRSKNARNKLNLAASFEDNYLLSFLDTLEVKEVDLMLHTIIAEGCDWLATHTNLSHDEIEGCRNLMLTVKEEQLKAQKGE
jgi:hypothetical protein